MKRFVVITGGSSGIGWAISKIYAELGHNLLLIARNEVILKERISFLNDRYNIEARYLAVDLATQIGQKALCAEIDNSKIQVTHLINSAGFGSHSNFQNHSPELIAQMIDLNVGATTKLTHYFISHMQKFGHGKILNLSSIAGFFPGPYMSLYFASKSFVLSLTEGLVEELKDQSITLSVLCPGPTESNFWNQAGLSDSILKRIPWKMNAEDVAKYAVDQFERGTTIIVPGFINKVMIWLPRILPRFITRKIVAATQKNL